MADTTNRSKLEALTARLKAIADSVSPFSPELADALQHMAAGIGYKDVVVVRSRWCDAVRVIIRHDVQHAEATKEQVRSAWHEYIEGAVGEDFDQPYALVASTIDRQLESMRTTRDKFVEPLSQVGCAVENARALDDSIAALEEFKEGVLNGWPLTSQPLPPPNRDRIAEARATFVRGEQGLRRSDLVWGTHALMIE